ncbi:hypothetical protein FRX31_030397, partial [Thalictrum thalictroides]
IWQRVKNVLGIRTDDRSSNCEWSAIIQICRGKKTRAEIYKAFVGAIVACIWDERNARKFRCKSQPYEVRSNKLIQDMKAYTQVQTNGLADCLDSQTLLRRLNIGSLLNERMVKHFQWRKPEE